MRLHRPLMTAAALVAAAVTAAPGGARPPALTPAERAEVNRVVDVFVNGAVKGDDPRAAYRVLSPAMTNGQSVAQWAREAPVHRYPARGSHFHHWTLAFADGPDVGIDLMLQPRRGASEGPIIFGINLKRSGGRFLVDSFIPQVVFAPADKPARVFAGPDVGPAAGGGRVGESRLGAGWLLVPVGVFAGLLLLPLALLGRSRVVERRAARIHADRTGRSPRPLPPLLRHPGC